MIDKLMELINLYKWTKEEFKSVRDLYEYTAYNEELFEATLEQCEKAFNSINK